MNPIKITRRTKAKGFSMTRNRSFPSFVTFLQIPATYPVVSMSGSKGGQHEKDSFDRLASSLWNSAGLPATRLLVGSSVVRPSGGLRGRRGAPWRRYRQPRVWALRTASRLRLSPACVWLSRSGLRVCLLRTAVLSRLWVPWLLCWKGRLWAPAMAGDTINLMFNKVI